MDEKKIKSIITEELKKIVDNIGITIDNNSEFNKIIGSVDVVEFFLLIEEQFDIKIETEEMKEYNTIDKLTSLVLKKISSH